MPSASLRALALLAVTPLLASFARAGGTIACYSTQVDGGVGEIPSHNPEFYDGTDTYIGGPYALACGEMVGESDPYGTWEGSDGRTISAKFWITDDLCMNVETNGNHYYCCPGSINQNTYSVTSCNWS